MAEQTYWNGLPTEAVRGTAVVADAPEFRKYWARDLIGTRIRVVKVNLDGVNYGGGVTYLDDRDGSGWRKVTVGMGGPKFGHGSVNIEEGSFALPNPNDAIEIGPECFASGDTNVISWRGENYYKACDAFICYRPDGGSNHCVKRVDHPGHIHEDYDGTTRSHIGVFRVKRGGDPDHVQEVAGE